MSEHVHVHAPHELSHAERSERTNERVMEFAAALLLSIATIAVAWSGYQAARWSGLQSEHYTEASAARSLANREAIFESRQQTQDLLNFNRWLEATESGDTILAALYERRFRPEFAPAFEAWLAQDPLRNPAAIASPLSMDEYRPDDLMRSNRLERRAHELFEAGREATENTDAYVFTTVFFAAMMFFAGMSLRFDWTAVRIGVLILAGLLMIYGLGRLASLPVY